MQIGDIEPLPRRAPTTIRTVLKVRGAPPLPPLAGHDRLSNRTVLCQESHRRPHSREVSDEKVINRHPQHRSDLPCSRQIARTYVRLETLHET